MLGIAATGTALYVHPVFAAETPRLFFYQLYSEGIELSDTTLGLAGQRVEIVGFMAPPLKADSSFFVLTDVPMEVCPFCDEIAQWPTNIIYVTSDRRIPSVPYNRQIRVSGVLDVGEELDPATGFVSLIRLEDAEVIRA